MCIETNLTNLYIYSMSLQDVRERIKAAVDTIDDEIFLTNILAAIGLAAPAGHTLPKATEEEELLIARSEATIDLHGTRAWADVKDELETRWPV